MGVPIPCLMFMSVWGAAPTHWAALTYTGPLISICGFGCESALSVSRNRSASSIVPPPKGWPRSAASVKPPFVAALAMGQTFLHVQTRRDPR